MKNVKTFLFTIIGIFLLFSCSASAASTVTTSEIYSLANGDYLETILIQDSSALFSVNTVGAAVVGTAIAYTIYQYTISNKNHNNSVDMISDDLGGEL